MWTLIRRDRQIKVHSQSAPMQHKLLGKEIYVSDIARYARRANISEKRTAELVYCLMDASPIRTTKHLSEHARRHSAH